MADHRILAIERAATLERLDRALGHLFAARGMTYQAAPSASKDPETLGLQQMQHLAGLAEQLVGYETLNPPSARTSEDLPPEANTSAAATDEGSSLSPSDEPPPDDAGTTPNRAVGGAGSQAEIQATNTPSDQGEPAASVTDANAEQLLRESREALDNTSGTAAPKPASRKK